MTTGTATGQDHDTIPGLRRILIERIDDAALERRLWLLDATAAYRGLARPDAPGPANDAQATALRLLESRRQAGRRRLRTITDFDALTPAADAAEALVRDVNIEDAPVWQTDAGNTIADPLHTVSAPAPSTDRWTLTLRAASPSPTAASLTQADLGDVVLDEPAALAGWAVTSAPRPAPHAHEIAVTLAQTATPTPGTHTLTLSARNARGPRRLTVSIVVPAPASE